MKTTFILLLCTIAMKADDATVQELVNSNNKFASTLYKEIVKIENSNFLLSPLSAEINLALTLLGSRDQTAQELQSALHLSNDTTRLEEGVKSLLPSLKESQSYKLLLANKVYIKNDFVIKDDFQRISTDVFGSASENIDFASEDAALTINNWVEKQTQNKIQNLVNPQVLNNDTRIVLVNALYFKADWLQKFYLAKTKRINFYQTATDIVQVDALSNRRSQFFLYYECQHLNAKFLELPFKGEEASLTIVLPNEKEGLTELEKQIERALVPHNLTKRRVEVLIPKFKIESTINLETVLKSLGVTDIFKDFAADISGISGEKGDLVVSEVVQKSFVDVSEEGVEAAAATYTVVLVPMSGYSQRPKEFIADHPFVFYIRVKGVIIFVGRVVNPRA